MNGIGRAKIYRGLASRAIRCQESLLHGDFDVDIYMALPEGFQSVGKEENLRMGYKRCAIDNCCYLKKVGSSSIMLPLYVDDMLIARSDMAEINKLKRQLSQDFEMKDLGFAKKILGMSISINKTKGTLRCQPLGDQFKLSKKQAPKTEAARRRMTKVLYASTVGSVMYAMPRDGALGSSQLAATLLERHFEGATLCFSIKVVVLEGFLRFREEYYKLCVHSIEKVADSFDDNSVDGLEDIIKDLSVEKKEQEANTSNANIFNNIVETCKEHSNDAISANESSSQPLKEEHSSDLSCP
ncbi:retrovirus-related pol polyprotein from transposon TNT 1-94 [Tanacetum coccineum]